MGVFPELFILSKILISYNLKKKNTVLFSRPAYTRNIQRELNFRTSHEANPY